MHREIYAEHRDSYDDDLHAKIAVGLPAVSPVERAELVSALYAWRAASAAACTWDLPLSLADLPGELPPPTSRRRSS